MDKLKKDNIWRFVEGLNLDLRRRQLIGKLIEEIVDSFADRVPAASNDNIGGIKTGYTQNGKNYPVTLDENKKAYVNVPWTDTKYNLPAATPNSIGGVNQGPEVTNASNDADTVALGTKINELIASLRIAGVIANTDNIPPAIKKSIIAWYSPKKQKLNNYDVIESYAEDFARWRIDNTGVTITQKKITIAANTELKYNIAYKDSGNSTDGFDIKYTGNAAITYRYNKEDGTVATIAIDKSGIYHLPASIKAQKNFGFYCYPQTVTEEATIEQLPTSILKDFSGNKHDAYLYGFKGKLNSGVGIYAQDFKNWRYGSGINNNISTKSYNKFHIVKKKADNWFGFAIGIPKTNYYNQSYKLKFTINKKIDDIRLNVVSTDGNLKTTNVYSVKINDGSIIDIPVISEEIFNNKEEANIYYDFGTNKDIEIDVELIADYPNQLCYDGKSYAVAYGLPILTDYTVMAERTWFENRNVFLAKGNITTEAKYAFIFEKFNPDGVMTVQSFGAWNNVVSTTDSCISYLTKNKYNGIDIRSGIGADDDMLSIGGALNKGNIELTSVCCHDAIIIADRSFTEEEINWLKDNLF